MQPSETGQAGAVVERTREAVATGQPIGAQNSRLATSTTMPV